MLISLGHSPDPDDAFVFWALREGRFNDLTHDYGEDGFLAGLLRRSGAVGAFAAPVQVRFVAR